MKSFFVVFSLMGLMALTSGCGDTTNTGGPGPGSVPQAPVVCSGNPIPLDLFSAEQYRLSFQGERRLPYGDYQFDGADIFVVRDDFRGHIEEVHISEDAAAGSSWNSSVTCESSNFHQGSAFAFSIYGLQSMRATPYGDNLFTTRQYNVDRNYHGTGLTWDFPQAHVHEYRDLRWALNEILPPPGFTFVEKIYRTANDLFEYRSRMESYSYFDGGIEIYMGIRFRYSPIY